MEESKKRNTYSNVNERVGGGKKQVVGSCPYNPNWYSQKALIGVPVTYVAMLPSVCKNNSVLIKLLGGIVARHITNIPVTIYIGYIQ